MTDAGHDLPELRGQRVLLRPLEAGASSSPPAWHGRGHGTDAMITLVDHLTTVGGHHRVILGTAIDNAAALRCYEKAGFRRVGVTRRSGRDFRTGEFGDEWFMELVVPPGREEP
ncbi:MAG: GNAT family N-acetyltransferase [Thermoleophilaceae bacterium]